MGCASAAIYTGLHVLNYMLMMLVVVWPWYWPEGSHKGRGSLWVPEGQYTKAIPLQATINLFINWLLDLTLIPRFKQAIMGFTRPLWMLLGHYGSAIMGSASHVIKTSHECP